MCSPLVTWPVLTKKYRASQDCLTPGSSVHCGGAAAIFGAACPPAWRRSINVPTMTEMSTELEATNPTGRKGRQARACPASLATLWVRCIPPDLLLTSAARCCGLKSGGILRTGLLGVTGRRDCYGGGLPRLERPKLRATVECKR